jgi:hypothetical protein
MTRRVLSDVIWTQLQVTLRAKGCHRWKNDREVMEAILWKLRTGAPWRDLPKEFGPWQTAFNRFNRWSKKGLWADFFLLYEAKLIRSGYSPTEATSALISMQAELGSEKSELSASPEEDLLQSFTWSPIRMEIRSILKSLGVKSTTPKRLTSSSRK